MSTLMAQFKQSLPTNVVKQLEAYQVQQRREARERIEREAAERARKIKEVREKKIAELRKQLNIVNAKGWAELVPIMNEARGILLEAKNYLDMTSHNNSVALQSFSSVDFHNCQSVLDCLGNFNITLGIAVQNGEKFKKNILGKCIDIRRRLEKTYSKFMNARGDIFVAMDELKS